MSSSPSRAARTPVLAALTVLMLAAACGGASDQPKIPLSEASGAASSAPDPRTSLSPAARTAIDSGNAAFRAGQFEFALDQYKAAAREAPSSAAPYYGMYMVAGKLGRPKLADSAMALLKERAGAAGKSLSDSGMKKVHAGE